MTKQSYQMIISIIVRLMQLEWIKTELRLLSYEFLELFEYLEQINSNEQATRMDQNGVTIIEL
jgi:hypothetical protein